MAHRNLVSKSFARSLPIVVACAALRAAQISMQSDKRWNAPHYWAAFTLQGEWR